MKKTTVLTLMLLMAASAHTQNLPGRILQLAGGYSKHGSGDMNGIVFGTEYSRYTSKKISFNFYFRGSINNSIDRLIFNNTITGTQQDASIRYTTAGVQTGINVRNSFIRSQQHELLIGLGVFGRYQSASHGTDGYSLYSPAVTGVPTFLIEFYNRTPQKTYSAGALLQLQYNFTFPGNITIGLAPGFQTDTNGDAILQAVLVLGKRFR
jgi:hypothetical protein